jgi:hypothetical protein
MPDFLAEALTWPENYEYYQALRAAKTWRRKPSDILLAPAHQLTKYEVKDFNRKFMVAYQILKDETCNVCGTIAWYGRSGNQYIEIETHKTHCHGCEAKEKADKSKDSADKLKEGETRYVSTKFIDENSGADGKMGYKPHGPGRTAWMLEMIAEAEKERRASDLSE